VTHTPRITARRRRLRLVCLLAAIAAAVAALDGRLSASVPATAVLSPTAAPMTDAPRRERRGPYTEGALPAGTTAFDDELAGVAKLDRDLLRALRRAAFDAGEAGITLIIDSGWRSPDYQQQLFDEAVAKHGSRAEAERWVATPDTSAHVTGEAVDIGPEHAAAWLGEHGVAYGLCRMYDNEPWHFELRPDAVSEGCPPTYPDPTHDPRMYE
jgi:D-alanyl-D-alanine carboxypeptidase